MTKLTSDSAHRIENGVPNDNGPDIAACEAATPKIKTGIDRAGEAMAKYGFTISAGDWIEDVYAVGVGLRMNDGTGPYAFNCGAPAFKFNEDRLKAEVGPRLVAMVRDIEAVLNGTAIPAPKPGKPRKNGSGGRVARVAEGIR